METSRQKSTNECALMHAKALVNALENANDFLDTKTAVWSFVTHMDGTSDHPNAASVLGDGDLGSLFAEALERRGKTPVREWAPLILAWFEVNAPEQQELTAPANETDNSTILAISGN